MTAKKEEDKDAVEEAKYVQSDEMVQKTIRKKMEL